MGPARTGKTGQRGVPRLRAVRDARSHGKCQPLYAFLEFIELSLSKGRNAKAIWQDLVDEHGFTGRYASVKRFVRKLRGGSAAEARAVIVTPPGEEGQVDYGSGPKDPVEYK